MNQELNEQEMLFNKLDTVETVEPVNELEISAQILPTQQMQDFFIGCGMADAAYKVGTKFAVCLITVTNNSNQPIKLSPEFYAQLKKKNKLISCSLPNTSSSWIEPLFCAAFLADSIYYFLGLLLVEDYNPWDWDDTFWTIDKIIESCYGIIRLPLYIKERAKNKQEIKLVFNKLMRELNKNKKYWMHEATMLTALSNIHDIIIIPLKQIAANSNGTPDGTFGQMII